MPIVLNGTTLYNGGNVTFGGSTVNTVVYSSTTVWRRSVTITDLIAFKGWSNDTLNTYPNLNTQDEILMPTSSAYSQGIVIYSASPGVGYTNDGRIYQNISLTSGHKYYVAVGGSGYGGCHLVVNFPNYTGEYWADQWQNTYLDNSAIWTSNVNGSYTVSFKATTNGGETAYCRVWYATVVDLTAAFGSGLEPTLSWCETNIGRAFNGSTNVIPPT